MERPRKPWLLLALPGVVLALLLCTGLMVDPEVGAQSEAILVAPLSLDVAEPAEQAIFTLSLTSQPLAPVTIDLQVEGDECTVSPETLLLDGTNWEAGTAATVTAQDDDIVDGEQPCTIVTAAASSTDPTFNGEDPDDVAVTVADDDVAGFSISPTALTLAEPDGQGTFTVALTSQPLGSVSFGLQATSDECTASPGRLELTDANWQVGAAVTVTVQDDEVIDGEQLCIVEMGRTKSEDPNYNHLIPPQFEVTVTDDDGARLSVTPAALTLAEPAEQGTFTLTLASQPTATVTVGLQAGSDECTVSPESLLLDGDNWQTGAIATVSVQNDDVADGEQACTIVTAEATSADLTFNGEDPDDVTVTVTDDDVAGFAVSPATLSLAEPAEQGTFTLTLTSQPTATVTVGLQAGNDECTVSPESLLLDDTNWRTGVAATVTVQDDDVADGEQTCTIVTAAAVSDDPGYGGEDPDDVTVTVTDNDVAGFAVSPAAFTLAEPAEQGTFTLTLTSQPTATVTVGLQASSDECTVAPESLLLDDTNWRTGVPAMVTVQDDDVVDGQQVCTIVTAAAVSEDGSYSGENPGDVTVTVTDDEVARLSIDPNTLSLAEPASQDTFTLTLASQPAATVTIGLQADGDECTVSPDSLLLDANNWQMGAIATVSVRDDDVADGEQVCTIVTAAAVSDDPTYHGEDPADVAVTVTDDDVAGFAVAPLALTLAEPAGEDSFTLALTSQPTATVEIELQAGSGECQVQPGTLLLDAANWHMGLTATVTVQDDDVVDGQQTCPVLTAAARSADPIYHGQDPDNVTVTVSDNDVAGMQVHPTILAISEPDGTAAFSVTLQSQPVASVTLGLTTSNAECTVSPASIFLDAANWNDGAIAIVAAVDDNQKDGHQTCVVQTALTASSDPNYNGRDPEDVIVAVYDDDVIHLVYLPAVASSWPPVPATPDLDPVENADGDGSFSLNWTASAQAESYVLEEATDSDFANAIAIYAGPATNYPVSNRAAARYYYRVKARIATAESGWSSPRTVDVRWELEPNDQPPAQVNGPIVPTLTYFGTFLNENDVSDYFFFNLHAPRRVVVWLSSIPDGMNYDLVLRDDSLAVQGYSAQLSNDDEEIQSGILPPGRYYIQIFHRSGAGSAEPYQLRFELE